MAKITNEEKYENFQKKEKYVKVFKGKEVEINFEDFIDGKEN